MSSKINGITPGQIDTKISRAKVSDGQSGNGPLKGAVLDDTTRVSLTDGARRLGELDQALKALPDVDLAKVEAVKTAISNGEYEVDTAELADALLRFDKDLG